MTLPISIFLYGSMGILAGIVSVNTYFTHRDTGSIAFRNFSLFFFFVFLFLIGTALLVYLSPFADNTLITSGFIGIRILVFLAFIYLIQIPVFHYFELIKRHADKLIALIIVIAFIATMLQIINFQEA